MDEELVPAHPGEVVPGSQEVPGTGPGKPPGTPGLAGIGVV